MEKMQQVEENRLPREERLKKEILGVFQALVGEEVPETAVKVVVIDIMNRIGDKEHTPEDVIAGVKRLALSSIRNKYE